MSVFVSYSKKNIEHVGLFSSENNQKDNLDLWIAYQKKENTRNIPPGKDFNNEIINAIKKSTSAVLFISNDFLNADFVVKRELPEILEKKEQDKSYKIIPILVEPIKSFEKFPQLETLQFINSPGTSLKTVLGNQKRLILREALDELNVEGIPSNVKSYFNKLKTNNFYKYFSSGIVLISILFYLVFINYIFNENETSNENNKEETVLLEMANNSTKIKDLPALGCINFFSSNAEENINLLQSDPFSFEVDLVDCDDFHDAQFLGKLTYRNIPGGEIDVGSSIFGFFYSDLENEENIFITDVIGAAKRDGLRDGDEIIQINNDFVFSKAEVSQILSRNKLREETLFTIKRDGEYLNIYVTPDIRTIQNDPDSILSYAIDNCTSSAGDFILQDEVFDHFLGITNDGQQWLTIPFVDYESQKYYSQFYVYCFIAMSEDGWTLPDDLFNRTGTGKLITSINSQKKDSIVLPFFNSFNFNELPSDKFITKTFNEITQGDCVDKASTSLEGNEKIKNNFVEPDMRLQIVDCTTTYGQILTTYELDTLSLLESPGSANFTAKATQQCESTVNEFLHIPTIAKQYSIAGFVDVGGGSDNTKTFVESTYFKPFYFYTDDTKNTLRVLCDLYIIAPNEEYEDGDPDFKALFSDDIFSNRTDINEFNNLEVDYCPKTAPIGYYYFDSNIEAKSLPNHYKKIKIPITWDATEDFRVESISWYITGSFFSEVYESESLFTYIDNGSPYKSNGSKSYLIEIETAGKNFGNYISPSGRTFNEQKIEVNIVVDTTSGDIYFLDCYIDINQSSQQDELELSQTNNQGFKSVSKKTKQDFITALDTSELEYPFLPKLERIVFEENLNADGYDIGTAFLSRYDIISYNIHFTLCEYPEVTPCINKNRFSYPGIFTYGSIGLDDEISTPSIISTDNELIKGTMFYGFLTYPLDLTTHNLDNCIENDTSALWFSLSEPNFNFNCFENNNPEEIYAVLNYINVTFAGTDEIFGDFTCDVSYQFFQNNKLDGKNLNRNKPSLPRILWGESRSITDGLNELVQNCKLLEDTGLGVYEQGIGSTYQKIFYYPNFNAENVWLGDFLGEIPKKLIYKKNS